MPQTPEERRASKAACESARRAKLTPEQREKCRVKQAEWRARNSEYLKSARKEWGKNNRKRVSENNKRWREENPDRAREIKMLHSYGISLDQYNEMLAAQGGFCAICHGDSDGKPFHIDHDHQTGVVRGLLCRDCNFGIGFLKDDVGRLRSAMEYLCRSK